MSTSDDGTLRCLVVASATGSTGVVSRLQHWAHSGLIEEIWVCFATEAESLESDSPSIVGHAVGSGARVPDLLQLAARNAEVKHIRGVFLHDEDVAELNASYVEDFRHIAQGLRRALPARLDGRKEDYGYLPLDMLNVFAPRTADPVFPPRAVERIEVPGVVLSLEDRSAPDAVAAGLRRGGNYESHVAAALCTLLGAWRGLDLETQRDLFLRRDDHENFARVRAVRSMVRIARTEAPIQEVADATALAIRSGVLPPLAMRRAVPRGPAQDRILIQDACNAIWRLSGDPTGFSTRAESDISVREHSIGELPKRVVAFGRQQTVETFRTARRLVAGGVTSRARDTFLGDNEYREIGLDLPSRRLAELDRDSQAYLDTMKDRPVVPRSEFDGMPAELTSALGSRTLSLIDGGEGTGNEHQVQPVLTDRALAALDPEVPFTLDSDVAVALNEPTEQLDYMDMWRLGGVIHRLQTLAPEPEGEGETAFDGAGSGYAIAMGLEGSAVPDLVEDDQVLAELQRCRSHYEEARGTFLGRVGERVAESLDAAVARLVDTHDLVTVPDFSARMRKLRKRFQIVVWILLFSAVIGTTLLLTRGESLTEPISRIPDLPEDSPWARGGVIPALIQAFRGLYRHEWAWVLTLLLILFLVWLWAANWYHKNQLKLDDAVRSFLTRREQHVDSRVTAEREYLRLAGIRRAVSPLAESLAWVIHNPQPPPQGIVDDGAPQGEESLAAASPLEETLPNSVRVAEIELSDKFMEVESRQAIERELELGWLTRTFMNVLELAFAGEGLSASQVIRFIQEGDQGATDIRPALLHKLRTRELDPALRSNLEERIREHRRALVDSSSEIDLLNMSVSGGGHETLAPFLTGLAGPKVMLNSSLWRAEGQAAGAAAGESGGRVTGEFRSRLWILDDLCDDLLRRWHGQVPAQFLDDLTPMKLWLEGDEIVAASVRIDALQWEPVERFACFREEQSQSPVTYPDEMDL